MPIILSSIILSLFILLINKPVNAANLSIELGKNSTGVAFGRDFGFGFGMVGLSAKFITDGPWTYIPTEDALKNTCDEFKNSPTLIDENNKVGVAKDCKEEGLFNDGDEWEVFGKLGFRIPLIPKVYFNSGIGVSRKKTTELFMFCDAIKLACPEDVCEPKSCSKAEEFVTWGHVKENYFMNFIGGITFEMTHRMLLNIDYHTRQGLLSGLMWRF